MGSTLRSLLFGLAGLGLFVPSAQAADVSLAASHWVPFNGSGSLTNEIDDVPGEGATTVLKASSSGAFGIREADNLTLSYPGRYVNFTLESGKAFYLYVKVRGSDNRDYSFRYSSTLIKTGRVGDNLYYTLSGNTDLYDVYQSYTLDIAADLTRLVPGVTLSTIRWFELQGTGKYGLLRVSDTADLTGDIDGDLLSTSEEIALGTNPFLTDSDGDGVTDGLEAQSSCADPLNYDLPGAAAALDPDADGAPTNSELLYQSDCASGGSSTVSTAFGWRAFMKVNGATFTHDPAEDALVLDHSNLDPTTYGVDWPKFGGPFSLYQQLNTSRERVKFSIKSAENFYFFFQVIGSNDQAYYVAYLPGSGTNQMSVNRAHIKLGNFQTFSGLFYTDVERNLSDDLGSIFPGVTVKKIMKVGFRGRGAVRNIQLLGPEIISVSPPVATPGDTLLIGGLAFGTSGAVTIGGVPATVTSWSDTSISVDIPASLAFGVHPVFVTSGNLKSNPGTVTLVPRIDTLTPLATSFTGGDTITLTGNFGADGTATVNGALAAITSWSPTTIVATVPTDAPPGDGGVVVTSNGQSSAPFAITVEPNLVSLSSAVVNGAQLLTFTGTNFGDAAQGGLVELIGLEMLPPDSWSNLVVERSIPDFAAPGPYALRLAVNGRVTQTQNITVSPVITSVSPAAVSSPDSIVITGMNFGTAEGAVTVGGVSAPIVSWGYASIEATIPAGAPVGTASVMVTQGGTTSNAVDITVEEPVVVWRIDSIDAAQATGGQSITLTGAFGTGGAVTINGAAATVSSSTGSSMVVVVPNDAPPGSGTVVVTSGAASSNAYPIVINPTLASLSSATPTLGSTLLLTGTNFGDVAGELNIDGFGFPADSWSALEIGFTILTAFPPGFHTISVVVNGVASGSQMFAVSPSITSVTPTHGTPTDLVTISGGNFGDTPSLTLGGVAVAVQSQTPDSISFYPPWPGSGNAAGAQDIVVTSNSQASNVVSFNLDPVILGIPETSTTDFDIVSIPGGYFGAVSGSVTIGGVNVTVMDWTDSTIQIRVAGTVPPGPQDVIVTVGGFSSGAVPYTVVPHITVDPTRRGSLGEPLTILGQNFGVSTDPGHALYVDGTAMTVDTWTPTAITFTIPASLAGSFHGFYVSAGGSDSNTEYFGMLPHIDSVSPAVLTWSGTLVVSGSNFNTYYEGGTQLLIDGSAVTVASADWTDTQIATANLGGLASGTHTVQVSVFGDLSNPVSMTVRPDIQELGLIAEVGTTLSLRGTAFGWDQGAGTVTVNGVAVQIVSWADYGIDFVVPPVASGVQTVVVDVNGQYSNGLTVEVIPAFPSIDWIDPSQASDGTPITLNGSHFGALKGSSRVMVGGVTASTTAWDDTQISAIVPAGIQGGYQMVSVVVGGVDSYIAKCNPTPINPNETDSSFCQVQGDVTSVSDLALSLKFPANGIAWSYGIQLAAPFPDTDLVQLKYPGDPFYLGTRYPAPTTPVASLDLMNGKPANGNWEVRMTDTFGSPNNLIAGYLQLAAPQGGLQSLPVGLILPPKISSLTPSSGPSGVVTIAGSGFGWSVPLTGGVLVNGSFVTPDSWSDTSIQITLPGALPGGPASIQVQVESSFSNTATYTVLSGLYISSVTPASASGGDTLTISGANFGSVQGTNEVTVGGYPLSVVSWTDASITATMPNEVTGGSRDVRVAVVSAGGGGGGGSSTQTYASTNVPQAIFDYNTSYSTLTVSGNGGTLTDVNVTVGISHTYYGDLVVALRHPDGTGVILQQNVSQNPNTTYDTYTMPLQSLSTLNGKPADGIWTLEVYDSYGGDSGSLNNWSLELTSQGGQGYSTYIAGDTPVSRTDGITVVSSVYVNAADSIADLNVNVSITQLEGYLYYCGLRLVHPDGTSVSLSDPYTLNGTNLSTSYATLTIPSQSLTAFSGKPMTGWWNLELDFPYYGYNTSINSWSLDLTPVGSSTAVYSNLYPISVKPVVSAFAPAQGIVGQGVTISGTNFGSLADAGPVTFGGHPVTVSTSWSATSIAVQIPTSVPAGASDVVVTAGGIASEPVGYTVKPGITAISPTVASGGDTVTLSGNAFGPSQGGSTVTLDGLGVTVLGWSDSSITVQIPNDFPPGSRVFVVTVAGQDSTGYAITIRPRVTSLNPLVGTGGDEIEILGTNFLATQGTSTVTFLFNTGTVTSWSNTRITALVSNSSQAGLSRPVYVRVNGYNSVAVNMEILPTLTDVAPLIGGVGDSVTITGTNFGNIKDVSTLTIGGVAATTTTWTATQIVATVPAGLGAGAKDIVAHVGGVASNALSITLHSMITAIAPAFGPVGTLVTLTGSGFGASQGGGSVLAGGTAAVVQGWSDTSVTFEVPAGLALGAQAVSVQANSLASNTVTFNVGGRIDGVSPVSGTGDDTVTISGAGFGGTQGAGSVTLGGVAATVTSWSDTSLTVDVPTGVTAGTRQFVVSVGGFATNAAGFTVTPNVVDVSPAGGVFGDVVVVGGTNFGTSGNTVSVGGIAQGVQSSASTQVVFGVSGGIEPGAVDLQVTTNGQTSNTTPFTVVPSLDSLSPAGGTTGTSFQVAGHNFGAAQASLSVGGSPATILSWNAAQVTFKVPVSLVAGQHDVVLTAGGQSSSALTATLKPAIYQVSPGSGTAGTTVTLTGSAWGAVQGASSLTFGGVAITASTWTPTSISFTVPMSMSPGTRGIQVVVNGQASAPVNFNVLFSPRIDSLSPVRAVTGTTVTLLGRFDLAVTFQTSDYHSCVLTSYGGVKCWGDNGYGQLGDGTLVSRVEPRDVIGLSSGVTALSSSTVHSCVLTSAGAVKCWGYNNFGEVGDGTNVNRSTPVTVSGLSSGVVALAAGGYHTCALLATGGLKCWGYNASGQLGNNSNTNQWTPVSVSGISSGVSLIRAGAYQTCALVSGALKCWGYNSDGAIGDGTFISRATPTSVSGMSSGVADVSLGNYFSCAVKTNGDPFCWGKNNVNQLGDGTTINRNVPTAVSGLSLQSHIALGQLHACALSSSGAVSCWGSNTHGQLGDGTTISRSTPVGVVGFQGANPVTSLLAGRHDTCVLMGGAAKCWGYNDFGQFGAGDNLASSVPVETRVPGSVYFGNTRAKVFAWSQTSVTVQVPSLADGAYPVTAEVWGVASNVRQFNVGLPVGVSGVAPASGSGGDAFTISGYGFETTQGASTVSLGGVLCNVTGWSAGAITAVVPASAAPGTQSLVVAISGQPSVSTNYTVLPDLQGVSPATGSDGDVLTLSGGNFGSDLGQVTVGGVPATAQSWSPSLIEASIPGTAPAGTQPVAISIAGQVSNSLPVDIVPVIAMVTPAQDAAGASVIISGSHLGWTQGGGTVSVGGAGAQIESWTMQSIQFVVPNLTAGNQDVAVTVAGIPTNTLPFTVLPGLNDLSPNRGPVGTVVTLTGTGFGDTQGTSVLDVGGATASVQSWSDSSVTFTIPAGLPFGAFDVKVLVNAAVSNAIVFHVGAVLAGVTPAFGSGGDTLTLNGTAFGATQGGSSVTLGGFNAQVVTWSDTQLTVELPAAVTAGVQALLANIQGFSSNAVTVSVLPKIVGLTPTSGTGGDVVTINGTNFGSTQQPVTIGGVAATVQNWSAGAIDVILPATVQAGSQPVVVSVGGILSDAAALQVYPTLLSVLPVTAPVGATVFVTGTNLGATEASGSLQIDGITAGVASWSHTSAAVTVPAAVPAGGRVVQAIVNGNSSNALALDVQPYITASSVLFADGGTGVTLTGTSFGASRGSSDVLVSGAPVTTSSWSEGQLTAWLPSNVSIQDENVWVVVGGVKSNVIVPLPSTSPWIHGRYPSHGTAGTQVSITGEQFGNTMGTVTIAGLPANIDAWTSTVVQVTVPAGVTKDTQPLIVVRADGLKSQAVPFTQRGSDVWLALAEEPSARLGHTAVWTGKEMIVWGGQSGTERLDESSSNDPGEYLQSGARYDPVSDTWLPLKISASSPSARAWHTAVWTGTEMIVWGGSKGYNYDYYNSGARYNPSSDSWTAVSATGAPVKRAHHVAVWTGQEMVVWGGQYEYWNGSARINSHENTGGRYNPLTNVWTATSLTNAPVARAGAVAAWSGSEMLVWGGGTLESTMDLYYTAYQNTGGRYDPVTDTWQAMATSGAPEARVDFTGAWTGNALAVWGGRNAAYLNTGALYYPATNTWETMPTANAPSARSRHAMVFTGDALLVWGGSAAAMAPQGGGFSLSARSWSPLPITGSPAARSNLTAVWTGSRMLAFGGGMFGVGLTDPDDIGGAYEPASMTWHPMQSNFKPTQRDFAASVWTGSQLVVWGGYDLRAGGSYLNSGWRYTLATDTWTPMSTGAGIPSARRSHSMVWDGNKVIVWGGRDAGSFPTTGARYDPAMDSWSAMADASAISIPGRFEHGTVWTGSEMIVWGGVQFASPYQSGGRYNPATNTWSATTLAGAPAGRKRLAAVWTGSKMIVWAGDLGTWNHTNTGGVYDPGADTWSTMSLTSAPSQREAPAAVWSGTEMLVWGGWSSACYYCGTAGRYDPATNTWSAMASNYLISGRQYATGAWTGSKFLVFGGYASDYPYNNGAAYSPSTNTWTVLTAGTNTPGPMRTPTSVWTGSEFIVLGGVNAGARYLP